jgi:hypothetical protein
LCSRHTLGTSELPDPFGSLPLRIALYQSFADSCIEDFVNLCLDLPCSHGLALQPVVADRWNEVLSSYETRQLPKVDFWDEHGVEPAKHLTEIRRERIHVAEVDV